jgi:transposase
MTPLGDSASLSSAEKEALIAQLIDRVEALTRQVEALMARVRDLEGENAVLREKLKLPPKTPDNSSLPPSRGHKASEEPGLPPAEWRVL